MFVGLVKVKQPPQPVYEDWADERAKKLVGSWLEQGLDGRMILDDSDLPVMPMNEHNCRAMAAEIAEAIREGRHNF